MDLAELKTQSRPQIFPIPVILSCYLVLTTLLYVQMLIFVIIPDILASFCTVRGTGNTLSIFLTRSMVKSEIVVLVHTQTLYMVHVVYVCHLCVRRLHGKICTAPKAYPKKASGWT